MAHASGFTPERGQHADQLPVLFGNNHQAVVASLQPIDPLGLVFQGIVKLARLQEHERGLGLELGPKVKDGCRV